MWLAIKLFGGKLLGGILRLFAWLCEDWLRIVVAGLAILSAILWFRGNDYRVERDTAQIGWNDEIAAHKQTEQNYREASAAALAAAQANKVRVETRYLEIENEADQDIRAKLAAATASLRAKARADSSGADATGYTGIADASISSLGAGEETIMDDLEICTKNTIMAEEWPKWWSKVTAVNRLPADVHD